MTASVTSDDSLRGEMGYSDNSRHQRDHFERLGLQLARRPFANLPPPSAKDLFAKKSPDPAVYLIENKPTIERLKDHPR
jgi:hypothetical protein